MVSDLPRMLAAGQLEQVKSALTRLVGQIEVQEEPRPGRKRPGAVLVLRGYMDAALRLAEQEIKGGGSPGGILTLVTFADPVRVMSLPGHRCAHRGPVDERGERQRVSASA